MSGRNSESSREPQPSIVESADDNDVSHRRSSLRRPRPCVFFSPLPLLTGRLSVGGYEEKCKMISSAAGGARTELAFFPHLTSEKTCEARLQDGGRLLL